MKCTNALDLFYETEDGPSLGARLRLAFHIILCRHCAAHLEKYEEARLLLQTEFFPPSPDFSNSIMNRIFSETIDEEEMEGQLTGPAGIPVKGWIIAGFVLIFSLATAFFGKDFASIVTELGSSFLLPLGIVTGAVITGYSALFIGSHLKEFSDRFRL